MRFFRLLRLQPWGFRTSPLLFSYEELHALVLKRCCSSYALCAACSKGFFAAEGLERQASRGGNKHSKGDCRCWASLLLRFVQGTDKEVHDTQRVLAMPQVLNHELQVLLLRLLVLLTG